MDKDRLYNWLGPIVVLLSTAILFWQPYLHTRIYEDFNYHLLVAQNYERAGGVVPWDYWESYPDGRPQNYPPLLHVLLVAFVETGLDPHILSLYVPPLFVAASLLLAWFGLKLLFGPRTALFFLLIAVSFERYFTQLGVTVPASLVLAASPLLLYLVRNGQRLATGSLLALMFYTHMVMPWFVVAALVLWTLAGQRRVNTVAFSVGGAILVYLPWGINILLNRSHIKYLNPTFEEAKNANVLTFPVFFYLLFLIAFGWFLLRARGTVRLSGRFFLLLFLIQTPLLFYKFPGRFTVAGGFFAGAVIAACFVASRWRDGSRVFKAAVVAFLVASQIGTLVVYAYPSGFGRTSATWLNGLAAQAIALHRSPEEIIPPTYPYRPENLRLAKTIRENTADDDPIYVPTKFFNLVTHSRQTSFIIGTFFAAMSDRAKLDARLPEAYWLPEPPVEKAKIVVADYHDTNLFPGKRENPPDPAFAAALDRDFELLHQEDRLAVFTNKTGQTAKVVPPDSAVSQWLAWLLVALAVGLTARGVVRTLQFAKRDGV